MYAIIREGGRQLKVEEGQEVDIDYRDGLGKGEPVTFERVLMLSGGEGGAQIGRPLVEGATVEAEVVGIRQGEKLFIQKFRRRKNSRRRTGHRQLYTTVKIQKING